MPPYDCDTCWDLGSYIDYSGGKRRVVTCTHNGGNR